MLEEATLKKMVTNHLSSRSYADRLMYLKDGFRNGYATGIYISKVALELPVSEGGIESKDVEQIALAHAEQN